MKSILSTAILATVLSSGTLVADQAPPTGEEAARIKAEQQARASAEQERRAAEAARQAAEVQKATEAVVRQQVEVAKQKAEAARQEAEAIRQQVEVEARYLAQNAVTASRAVPAPAAVPKPPAPPALAGLAADLDELASTVDKFGFAFGGSEPGRSIVIGSGKTDASQTSEIEEDLNVMARIFDKAVSRESGNKNSTFSVAAMGIPISFGGRGSQNFYLEGYGAVFQASVGFPLLPPPAKQEEKTEKPADSEWDKAKREIYGQGEGGSGVFRLQKREPREWGSGPGQEYDAEKVEKLKRELLESLKNAANIRHLRPDEYIAIVVTGGGDGHAWAFKSSPKTTTRSLGSGSNSGSITSSGNAKVEVQVDKHGYGSRSGSRPATMTIRVKKSDVDSFAKDQISFDAFKQKAAINVY